MIKILLTLLLFYQFSFANDTVIAGKWHAASRSLNNGTELIEKEYLHLYPNSNFQLVLLVSVKKGDAYIKDLRIEVSGKWEARHGVLVYVIKKINVPVAKEVYLISQKSLENLATSFKQRYQNNSIHILKIKELNKEKMTTINKRGSETLYKR